MSERFKPVPRDEEIELDPKRYIFSKTDKRGIILYGNPYFVKISGYSLSELIGSPHNIIRHPDMPKVIFKLMWDRINKGQNIIALVKNLAKDGRYYWVMTEFEPKRDPLTNEIVAHAAYRRAAPKKAVETIIPIYQNLLAIEKNSDMYASEEALKQFLNDKKLTYDEFIDNITGNKGAIKLFFMAFKKLFR